MINNFLVLKKDNQGNDNLPSRRLTTNTGTKENPVWKDLGVAWVKKNAQGEPFLSVTLEKDREYTNRDGQTVKVDGYVIITESEYRKLKLAEAKQARMTSPTDGYPNGINMATHPLNSEAEQKDIDERFTAFETNNLEDIPF